MAKIIHNMMRCNRCGDEIESTSRHDFKWCSCHSVAVDGGHDYLKRCGDLSDWTDISVIEHEPEDIHEAKT